MSNLTFRGRGCCLALAIAVLALSQSTQADETFQPVALRRAITRVQPMTGIVLWTTNPRNQTDTIQLEYSYRKYSDIVSRRGAYDWRPMDRLLDEIAARGHQAIIRFYFEYPGRETTVPAYIKALPDYREVHAPSEGKKTGFSDWSHPELKRFVLEFYQALAARYDRDPRLAFLETGFGLWAEYHIYDGPERLGQTFPDMAFQAEFAAHLGRVFQATPWMISVDAADDSRAPFAKRADLLGIPFGVFDDSFLCEEHPRVNALNWNTMGRDRWQRAPAGGEFSYYTKQDQEKALAPTGPHGTSFERSAAAFHVSFMIGDGQTRYQRPDRIRDAGLACGYKFRILAFDSSPTRSRVTVTNTGVAPIYQDAHVAVNDVRAIASLKGLLPGRRQTFTVESGGLSPRLTIACDRLVPGQQIDFEADLDGKSSEHPNR